MARTDQEIVDQTNEVAHRLLFHLGYQMPAGFKFYAEIGVGVQIRNADGDVVGLDTMSPHKIRTRTAACWNLACEIQELLTTTDPNDALSALED